MMRIDFYQLSRDPVEQVVPRIAERVLDEGARLLIVSSDRAQLDRISLALWQAAPTSFLANDHADADKPQVQPILLSAECTPLNGATRIAIADGTFRDQALNFERIFYLFGDARLDEARAAWRTQRANPGAELHFWRQEGARWHEGP